MLIIPEILLLSEQLTQPLSHARIGWNSYTLTLTPDDVEVSSETAIGPGDAPNNPETYSFWEPAALPATRDLDLGELKPVDFAGLVGQVAGYGFEVRISEDVDDFNDYLNLAGVDGNYASTPDSAAASVTGDLHLELELSIENADLPDFSLDFLGDFQNSIDKITGGSPAVGSFTRSGDTATRVNEQGLIETVLANIPRQDYHPITRAIRGLLIEEQRTNLLLRSREFDNASWTKTRASISAGATTGPDGTSSADKLVEDSTAASSHLIRQSVTKAGSAIAYALTWEVKAAERTLVTIFAWNGTSSGRSNGNFNLANGVANTFQNAGAFTGAAGYMEQLRDGWWRCTLTFTSDTETSVIPELRLSNGSSTAYDGDGTSGVYVGHAQLEAATFASSDIFTEGSSVTRSAETVVITDLTAANFNDEEGTIIVQADTSCIGVVNRFPAPAAFNDNSNNNLIGTYLGAENGAPRVHIRSGGVGQAETGQGFGTVKNNTPAKLACRYKENDAAISTDGSSVITDSSVTLPTVDRLYLGANGDGTSNKLMGHLQEFFYYASGRLNATLQDFSRQTYRCLASKWAESGNQRSWALCLKENLALVLYVSTDGTAAGIREFHSAPLEITEGTRFRIRVKLDLDNGSDDSVCTFETSEDDGATWDTLSTVTQATVSGIFDSTAPVEVGAFNGGTAEFQGKLFQFWLHADLNDGPVLHFDASEGETGDTSITSEDTGEVWTIHSTGPATALKIKRFSLPAAPADDAPLMWLDEGRQARRMRLIVTGDYDADRPPRVAVFYTGPVLALQRPIYGGHTPIHLARKTELQQPLSQGGQLLGQAVKRLGVQTSAQVRHLKADWYREHFDPFVKHARQGLPYFWAWRPRDYPREVAFVWTEQDIRPTNMGKRDYLEVGWSMVGIGWE